MTRYKSVFLTALFLLASIPAAFAELPSHPLIEKAKEQRGPRVQYALQNGVEIVLTSDGKSFYLLWFPEGYSAKNPPPMIATMHGHGGWAFEDFHVWHSFLKERGYGLLAIQWWLGEGESTGDYLRPEEIYRTFDQVLGKLGLKPGTALLHGFSRGSANIYPVAVLDRTLHKDYFGLFIANAGRANSGYPPVQQIEQGKFGERPLEGSHWVTYAGGKDTNPDRDGIPGMRETGDWIRKYGGTVDLAIEDPDGDHGGFHRRSENTKAALDHFAEILTARSGGS
jgi:hypothetical protein